MKDISWLSIQVHFKKDTRMPNSNNVQSFSTAPQSTGNYSQLLETLYGSLLDDKGFEKFLFEFKDHFKGTSATLMAVQKEPREMRWGWTVGVPEKIERWYIENDMVSKDPSIDLFEEVSKTQQGFITAGLLLEDVELIDTVTDDFKPWLKAEKIVDTAGLVIPSSNSEHLILAVQRNIQAGRFTEEEVKNLNLLAPHIRQAVQLFIKFYRQQHDNSSLQAAINTLSQPTIVINELMQVRHINPSAETLIQQNNEFRIVDEKFILKDKDLHDQFMYQAWDMARAAENLERELTSTLIIPSANNPITITLSPMFAHDKNSKFKGVLLQIFDPTIQTLPNAESIKSIFKLSNAEAALCEFLVQGLTLKEIAKERNVSINTVREQMRNIFIKTGYNRQSELIAAILRAVP